MREGRQGLADDAAVGIDSRGDSANPRPAPLSDLKTRTKQRHARVEKFSNNLLRRKNFK
jgi:hypothetical protein